MGCDIHMCVEVFVHPGVWCTVFPSRAIASYATRFYEHALFAVDMLSPLDVGRDYSFFAELAGVRGDPKLTEYPLGKEGLPWNINPCTESFVKDADYHSFGHAYLAALERHPWALGSHDWVLEEFLPALRQLGSEYIVRIVYSFDS